MSETSLQVTPGAGASIAQYLDAFGNLRQAIVLGDTNLNTASIPQGVLLSSNGGAYTNSAMTAGKSTITIISSQLGRICRAIVTATGSAAVTFYDNASAASGTIVGYIPASAAVGSIYDFQFPVANGIVATGNASNPAVTVSFVGGYGGVS